MQVLAPDIVGVGGVMQMVGVPSSPPIPAPVPTLSKTLVPVTADPPPIAPSCPAPVLAWTGGAGHTPGLPVACLISLLQQEEYDWSDYPLYHTTFEDFDAMKNLLDPEFRYHLALGRLWALMGLGLADSQILPMDPEDETVMLRKLVAELREDFGDVMQAEGVNLDPLEAVVGRFEEAARAFNAKLHNLSSVPPLLARQLNDQLMLLEKCYTHGEGSHHRPHMKNMVFGTDNLNQYGGWLAPGVRDAMWEAKRCSAPCPQEWQVVQQQLSVLQAAINAVALTLKDIQLM